jgi:hypothetical protein
MSLFSLSFAALFATALLMGAMVFFSGVVAPLVFAKLPAATAGRFIRQLFPFYYGIGAALALLAALAAGLRVPGLILGVVGCAFLFALLWLMPAINRNRDKGMAGDEAALAAFDGLHRASVALNLAQLAGVALAFVWLALRW